MRLRDLRYPIAILKPHMLVGGKDAGLNSPRRWNNNDATYYQRGGFVDATVFDSEGRVFEIEKVYLNKTSFLGGVFWRVMGGSMKGSADVDMDLREIDRIAFADFCQRMRNIALAHPEWWKRHSEKDEIENMFVGCKTFSEAINSIGVLDTPGKERLKGLADNVVDRRP